MAKEERQLDLDILRALSIMAVVAIHVVSISEPFFKVGSNTHNLLLITDQISRFAVPLFVAISGYALAKRYGPNFGSLTVYFKRRIQRTVPSYLLVGAIIYLYLNLSPYWLKMQTVYPLWKLIFLGKIDFHLYFVPMIFQLYLIFPLITVLKKHTAKILLLSFFIQTTIYLLIMADFAKIIHLPLIFGDQQQYLLSLTWIFYFVLGIFLAQKKINSPSLKKLSFVLLFSGLVLSIYDCFQIVKLSGNILYATRFTRIPILAYSTGVITVFFIYSRQIFAIPQKLKGAFAIFGQKSYVVYLIHTLVIRIFYQYLKPQNIPAVLFIFSGTIFFSLVFSIAIEKTIGFNWLNFSKNLINKKRILQP